MTRLSLVLVLAMLALLSPTVRRPARVSRRSGRRREVVSSRGQDPVADRPLCARLSPRVGADVCALLSAVAPRGAAL